MLEREFLGWDEPFLTAAVRWLLAHRDELPYMLIVVPTAQSGRRLRETLAAETGALLAPRLTTPGAFLQLQDPQIASDWVEQVAWVEVFEDVQNWEEFTDLFPEKPGEGTDWAGGLAREMVKLRRSLQENGLTISMAARKLSTSIENGRWDALTRLEDSVEKTLHAWGHRSRSSALVNGILMPQGISQIVLAGVPEMPPLVERAWLAFSGKLTVLVGAPPSEADHFSPIGRPATESWNERILPWPNSHRGSVRVTADPRQQAIEALQIVADAQTPSDDLVLGAADEEVGAELARAFSREGWPAFLPAESTSAVGLTKWLGIWSAWLADPTLEVMADLLTLPETGVLVGGKRAQKAVILSRLRDRWMCARPEDLTRKVEESKSTNEKEQAKREELCKAAADLMQWRSQFLSGEFPEAMSKLLENLGRTHADAELCASNMVEWLVTATPLIDLLQRRPTFWIELMISQFPPPAPLPPEGRVIDVQGWLELFHEPGSHLVLCGMNDGKVPARSGGEPWLSEASRKWLGLIRDADRAARDAYLFHAILEARRTNGRVDILCGKSGAGGETLLPSRLLLSSDRSELPARVRLLFREVAPPEAGLRWQPDWQWKPLEMELPVRLNVTSLASYLTCPFRYYLSYGIGMQTPEAGRGEWNARNFGVVAHTVLERWGRDTDARDSSDEKSIHAWLSNELDRVVIEWFDKRVPLSIRIQTEALRSRFRWLARAQAAERAAGWQVIDVETKMELPVGNSQVVAVIDRIDRNTETGRMRVLDYKTGKMKTAESAHRKKVTAHTVLPAHFTMADPVIHTGEDARGKSSDFRWTNLQLPLYVKAVMESHQMLATPCYFSLGATEAEVAVNEWAGFEEQDLEAASACADWVVDRINKKVFWPPAAKVEFDNYEILASGRNLEEMILRGYC